MKRSGKQLVIPLAAVLVAGCNRIADSHEVAHVPSPNGKLEAIVTEKNGGATTSFGYEVSVRRKGAKASDRVADLYGAVRNTQAYGVDLRWASDHVLQVQYLRAQAVQNVLHSVTEGAQTVQVELQSGIEDFTAPAGGMHYNQTNSPEHSITPTEH